MKNVSNKIDSIDSGSTVYFHADTPGEYVVTATHESSGAKDKAKVSIVKVSIDSLSPDEDLVLGEDLDIDYKLAGPSGLMFDAVELQVLNYSEELVYKLTDLPTALGEYSVTWENAEWNQAPHDGDYANPNNGDYIVLLVASKNGLQHEGAESINTTLVLRSELRDEVPVSGEIRTCLDSPVTRVKLDVSGPGFGLMPWQADGTNLDPMIVGTLYSDVDGDGVMEIISTKLEYTAGDLDSLPDGEYTVTIKDVYDKAGNPADSVIDTDSIDWPSYNFDLN